MSQKYVVLFINKYAEFKCYLILNLIIYRIYIIDINRNQIGNSQTRKEKKVSLYSGIHDDTLRFSKWLILTHWQIAFSKVVVFISWRVKLASCWDEFQWGLWLFFPFLGPCPMRYYPFQKVVLFQQFLVQHWQLPFHKY